MQFEFATSNRVIFGTGAAKEAAKYAGIFGRRVLVVAGRSKDRTQWLLDSLEQHNLAVTVFTVDGEPTIEMALRGVTAAKAGQCDVVIAMGGGSVLDSGKAIAALVTNPGDPMDYLEVIGRGQPLTHEPLPVIALPTTAGTGSEVTRNAVLASPEKGVKVSLRSAMMLPKIALVDPELTYGLPPIITATTGMDALTQVIEPYTSNAANPMTDALCKEAIPRGARAIRKAYFSHPHDDYHARAEMALVSLFGGLALANAKLGAVHGFAGVLGGMYNAPHGAICAALLPYVMEANIAALRRTENPILRRYEEVARWLTENENARPEDGAAWVKDTCTTLQILRLRAYGVQQADFPDIVAKSAKSGSMKGNPIPLSTEELTGILEAAY
jgi:alcohol dehydrogenase class IV